MFARVAAFEFRYQLRQPAFWVIAILFGLLGFGLIAAGDFMTNDAKKLFFPPAENNSGYKGLK
jgi:uncharacterized membrane protein YtjA (UPF0391 family)